MSRREVQLETCEEDDEQIVEERAERIVAVEEQFEDALDGVDDQDPDVSLDLTWQETFTDGFERVDVVGVRKIEAKEEDGDWNPQLTITTIVDGGEEEFSLPWPTDPTDRNEPAVRLCNHCGVTLDRIGDIDSVPVVRGDDGWHLVVPPKFKKHGIEIVLPNGKPVSFSVPSFYSGLAALNTRATLMMCNTKWVKPKSGRGSEFKVSFGAYLGLMLLASSIFIPFGAAAVLTSAMLLSISLFPALIALTTGGGVDLY